MAAVDPTDAFVITGYLNGAQRAAQEAQAALDWGDLDAARGFIDNLVHAARQALARAEEADRGDGSEGGPVTPWEAEHGLGKAGAASIEVAERMAEHDR